MSFFSRLKFREKSLFNPGVVRALVGWALEDEGVEEMSHRKVRDYQYNGWVWEQCQNSFKWSVYEPCQGQCHLVRRHSCWLLKWNLAGTGSEAQVAFGGTPSGLGVQKRGALTEDCFPFQLAIEVKIKQTKSLFSQAGHQTIWKWIIQVLFKNIQILEMKKALGQRRPERLLLCPRLLRPSVNGLILEYRSPDCHPMLFSLWAQMHSA